MDSASLQQRLDRNYRFQRHVYDMTREYYLLGRDTLIAGLVPPERGTVLEIGCGTARNLVRASARYPQAQFFGLDLSQAILETAGRNIERSGLSRRVRLAHGDAARFDAAALFGRSSFDRVFFSYALSMMPAWVQALDHAAAHLAAGGSLHIVDFGRGDGLPRPANAVLRAWLGLFHTTPRDGLESELRRLASWRAFRLFLTPLYRTYAVYAVLTKE